MKIDEIGINDHICRETNCIHARYEYWGGGAPEFLTVKEIKRRRKELTIKEMKRVIIRCKLLNCGKGFSSRNCPIPRKCKHIPLMVLRIRYLIICTNSEESIDKLSDCPFCKLKLERLD